jgi:ABC-type transport system substrate-binding protein
MLFEWVVPAVAVDPDTFAEDWNDRLWMAGGPFEFVSYQPAETSAREPGRILLERNDAYWEVDVGTGAALPYLDSVEVLAIPGGTTDIATLLTWMDAGSLDLVTREAIGPDEQQFLDGDMGYEIAVEWDTMLELLLFQFDDMRFEVNADSLNEHLLYRQAALSAIDRVALGEALLSAPPVTSILGTSMPALESSAWAGYDDPARADALLAELGAALGRDFVTEPPHATYVTDRGEVTELIGDRVVSLLGDAGFDALADYTGFPFFPGRSNQESRYDLGGIRYSVGPGLSGLTDALALLDPSRVPDELLVDWGFTGEPADRYADLVDAAATEIDPDQLVGLLEEAEATLAEHAIVYPLVRRLPFYRVFSPERVQGFEPNRFHGWDSWNAAWWWSPQQ